VALLVSNSFLGHLHPQALHGLILAGSGAGLAANFNAPLTGALFSLEVASRSLIEYGSVHLLGIKPLMLSSR
jgi:H+/Cl- antiporter ClcA